jgi:hypothetical protein
MSSRIAGLVVVTLIATSLFAQNFASQIGPAERQGNDILKRAAQEIDASNISRGDALEITAAFIRTKATREALRKEQEDYVRTMEGLESNHASKFTTVLTASEGQYRIMQCANMESSALSRIVEIAQQFSLSAPDASELAGDFAAAKQSPVVR